MPDTRKARSRARRRYQAARRELVRYALLYVESTRTEMASLREVESATARAGFMLLHESADRYKLAEAFHVQEKSRD